MESQLYLGIDGNTYSLSVDLLAQRCQQETEKYLAGHSHDERYCLELFRRALLDHDQAAWGAIYTQYEALVANWVRCHSKFERTGEEATFFVNVAFARFWRSLARPEMASRFDSLSQLLRYLKSCAHSAIKDTCRQQQHWPPEALAWDEFSEVLVDDVPSLEEQAIIRAKVDVLERALMRELHDETEKVVALLSWRYGLSPREIQTRHPDLFADIASVYRVKRNILNRLLRDSEIQKIRADG